MKLNSIKIAGFKSFPDPVVLPFKGKINAVVGPNGCGKSNIVDALRWVSGVISAKQLRGQAMADVIFNGAGGRKPLGKASIEILFDNTDEGRLTGEYAKFSQISIRRELSRDGQSHYYINGATCRRKDVLDIFLGTGLGPRSYAIIEQGMVSQLIEAKPEELRVFIEEAAGISKYKERRRETENRLRHTQENLDRLQDVINELNQQLNQLKRQVGAAERYQVLKAEEQLTKAQSYALQFQRWDAELQSLQNSVHTLQLEQEQQLAQQRALEHELEVQRQSQVTLNEQLHDQQKMYYAQGAEITKLQQQMEYIQARRDQLQKEQLALNLQLTTLQEQVADYQQQIQDIQQALASLSAQLSHSQAEFEAQSKQLQAAEQQFRQQQVQWERSGQVLNQLQKKQELLRLELKHSEQQRSNNEQRLQRLLQKQQDCEPQENEAELAALLLKQQQLQSDIANFQQMLTELLEQQNSYRAQIKASREQIETQRELIAKIHRRQATLEALQQAALQGGAQAAQQWIKTNALQKKPRLAQTLQVSAGWELAVETVLSRDLDALCVEAVEPFVQNLAGLVEGELALIQAANCTAEDNAARSPSHPSLFEKIQDHREQVPWLQQIWAAESIHEAISWQKTLAPGESIITREGLWLGENWVRVFKRMKKEDAGVLTRQKELLDLQAQVESQSLHLTAQQQQLQQTERDLQANEKALSEQRLRKEQGQQHLNEVKTQCATMQARRESVLRQRQQLTEETLQLEKEQEKHKTLFLQFQQELLQIDQQLPTHQNEHQVLLQQKTQAEQQLGALRASVARLRQQRDEAEIRCTANQSQLHLLTQTAQRETRHGEQAEQRLLQLQTELENVPSTEHTLLPQLQKALQEHQRQEQTLQALQANLNNNQKALEAAEKKWTQTLQQLSELQKNAETATLEKRAVEVRQTTVLERLQEIGFELHAVLAQLPEEASLAAWEEKLEQVAQKIQRLGAINLAAMETYQTESARKVYLDTQHQDLSSALAILQEAIRKIDKETKTRFKTTFDQVNAYFAQLFPKVFRGGQATLELIEDDLLNTGVLVRAQPPGKRNATIQALSGGEKALTAISLIFALFQWNPAPFCVLDEVDAPLDDANVGRFSALVKEMSETVQFIMITHNKVSMEVADDMLGITMHEPGVSRVVSVAMEEAVALVS